MSWAKDKINVSVLSLLVLFLFLIGLVIYLIMRVNAVEATCNNTVKDNKMLRSDIGTLRSEMYSMNMRQQHPVPSPAVPHTRGPILPSDTSSISGTSNTSNDGSEW